jgi:hypothetical protein
MGAEKSQIDTTHITRTFIIVQHSEFYWILLIREICFETSKALYDER